MWGDGFVLKLHAPLAGAAACTSGSECSSTFCADGVCCDRACDATCEACTTAKKGGSDGTCGVIPDGQDPDKECAPASCAASVATTAQVCNGAASCRSTGTVSCGLYACVGISCGASCAIDGDCIAGAHCVSSVCVADLAQGAACDRDAQCTSGHCADSVCCDTACARACEACTATKKGSGADGTCGNVAADTDPKNACPTGSGVCPADGLCDGAGNCRSYAKTGTPCGPTTCAAGSVSGKICKGDSATCVDDTSSCGLYACGATACKTTCASDTDCAADARCGAGSTCVAKLARGAKCTTSLECGTGICADGVCCNSTCGGQCESCSESGTAGTCVEIAGAPRGGRAACDALAEADCAKTTCDGKIGSRLRRLCERHGHRLRRRRMHRRRTVPEAWYVRRPRELRAAGAAELQSLSMRRGLCRRLSHVV